MTSCTVTKDILFQEYLFLFGGGGVNVITYWQILHILTVFTTEQWSGFDRVH